MKPHLLMLHLAAASIVSATAADLYWNGADIAANPANGGTGTWNTANSWRSGSATGEQATWTAGPGGTDNAFLAGSAGTVTLGTSGSTNFTGANLTVSTSGYSIASESGSRDLIFSGTLALSSSVALTLDMNNTDPTWGVGTINFTSGSSLVIQGNATANNANRFNLSAAGTIAGGSITLAGTDAGPTGFVGTASGVVLNTDILNNSAGSATMLGANNNQSLEYGGVLGGTAKLQISGGQTGGAGTVLLTNQNTYTGDTYLNHTTAGVLRIGVSNALPAGTTLFFAQSAGGGTADTGGTLDLNGQNQTLGALDGTGRGVVNTTSTLSTLTVGKASGTHTFSGVIGTPGTTTNISTASNQIALVKTGASTQILAGANTYIGSTSVEGGGLVVNGSIAGSVVTVSSGGKLAGTGTVGGATTIRSGGKHSAGAVGEVGGQTFSNGLNYQSGSIFEWDLASASASSGFDKVTLNGGTLTGSGEFRVVTDLDFSSGTFWASQQTWSTIFSGAGTLTGWATAQAATVYSSTGTLRNISSIGSFTIDGATLTWNAVPEHSNVMIGGLIALGLLRRKRTTAFHQ
jgi:autotransporter-associated beta strand protein